jgi:hypothetical protein
MRRKLRIPTRLCTPSHSALAAKITAQNQGAKQKPFSPAAAKAAAPQSVAALSHQGSILRGRHASLHALQGTTRGILEEKSGKEQRLKHVTSILVSNFIKGWHNDINAAAEGLCGFNFSARCIFRKSTRLRFCPGTRAMHGHYLKFLLSNILCKMPLPMNTSLCGS